MPFTPLIFSPPYTGIIRGGDAPDRIERHDISTGTIDIRNIHTIAGSTQVIAGFAQVTPDAIGRGARDIRLDADFTIVSMPILSVALPGYALAEILLCVMIVPTTAPFGPRLRNQFDLVRIVGASNRQSIVRYVARVFAGVGNNFLNASVSVSVTFPRPDSTLNQRFALCASVESWAGVGGWAQAEASVFGATLDQFTMTCMA